MLKQATVKNLSEIQKWLELEYKKTGEGFYVNLDNIENAQKEKRLLGYQVNNEIIGFIVSSEITNISYIAIFVIKPDHRGKGIGGNMLNDFISKSNKTFALYLECNPPSSEPFWKNNDFVEYSKNYLWRSRYRHLYRIIFPHQISDTNINDESRFELWDENGHSVTSQNPKWVWSLLVDKKTTKLNKPIIFPYMREWKCRLIKNGNEIYSGNIAYLRQEDIQYSQMCGFMVIK